MNTQKKQTRLLLWLAIIALVIWNIPLTVSAHHSWKDVQATNIEGNTATLNATVIFTKTADVTTNTSNYKFEYSTDETFNSNVTTISPDTAVENGTEVTITKDIAGLNAGTTYFFRAMLNTPDHYSQIASFHVGTRELIATSSVLSENVLDGYIISLDLKNDTYAANAADYVQFDNPPPGTTPGPIHRLNDETLHITLNYSGTDFDTDHTNFTITILEGGFVQNGSTTSNSITVKALTEVEGYNKFTSLGNSYPTKVEMTGYNIRDKQLHFNTVLHTDKDTSSSTATFYYFATVYDQEGNSIGMLGDYDNPLSVTANPGSQEAKAINAIVSLTSPLTSAYRIVVIVKEVTLS